mmetsp:Transcript_8242/g.20128  ORF Transcript_8242/g.20128 Transcript_8242/m.20128 type:complete len:233 (+) Transcript_8242:222-920(+)
MRSDISSMPTMFLTCANTVGPSPLIFLASRSITLRSAPTASARSVLLTMSRSLCVTPGPPFLGTLSPPATSTTYMVKSESSREKLAARLSPPLSIKAKSGSNCVVSSSSLTTLPEISSRIAAWGQPPVSRHAMRSAGSASLRVRKSQSSFVKMSFVTTQRLYLSRRWRHMESTRAVFPLPTGPPMPTVKARCLKSRLVVRGGSRSSYFPASSICSWVCPCSWEWECPWPPWS